MHMWPNGTSINGNSHKGAFGMAGWLTSWQCGWMQTIDTYLRRGQANKIVPFFAPQFCHIPYALPWGYIELPGRSFPSIFKQWEKWTSFQFKWTKHCRCPVTSCQHFRVAILSFTWLMQQIHWNAVAWGMIFITYLSQYNRIIRKKRIRIWNIEDKLLLILCNKYLKDAIRREKKSAHLFFTDLSG